MRNPTPSPSLRLALSNVFQPPSLHYSTCCQVGHLLRNQTPVSYGTLTATVTPLCGFGCNQLSSKDAVYPVQWPSPAMMYAQSYAHLRHGIVQVLLKPTILMSCFTDGAWSWVVITLAGSSLPAVFEFWSVTVLLKNGRCAMIFTSTELDSFCFYGFC